ncbi:alpha/beta fold hydrolase [Idiomarina xiamenensis]|uniref:Alpha/beta hydrolase n=1 Tax=Idiomarina xiamenensis 10-D-4 TaxID=740709 RepID=K2K9C3_9GAMM|nr:alpha/beta hydrolase [Idiomarina xiamenensis]EKE84388.1 alpha/beta hydrolase [Idiomarina xiamenensis 10-D-4]
MKNCFITALCLLLVICWQPSAFAKNDSSTLIHAVSVQGDGQDVILIPGLMSDARVWQQTADLLATRYRVHTLNIAGFGEQPAARQLRQEFMRPLVAAISDYLNTQTSHAIIVGHSLGATLGYQLIIEHPDVGQCLVSVDGVPFVSALLMNNSDLDVAQVEPQAAYLRQQFQQFSAQQLRQQTQFGVARQAADNAHQAMILNMAEQSDAATVGQAMYELMTTDLRKKLKSSKVPILQLAAIAAITDDAEQQQALQQYRQQLPPRSSIELKAINARHFIMLEQPQTLFDNIQRFAKEHCHE